MGEAAKFNTTSGHETIELLARQVAEYPLKVITILSLLLPESDRLVWSIIGSRDEIRTTLSGALNSSELEAPATSRDLILAAMADLQIF